MLRAAEQREECAYDIKMAGQPFDCAAGQQRGTRYARRARKSQGSAWSILSGPGERRGHTFYTIV
eukprot:72486-Prymnesium_polylepis.3